MRSFLLLTLLPLGVLAQTVSLKVYLQGPYLGNGQMKAAEGQHFEALRSLSGNAGVPAGAVDLVALNLYQENEFVHRSYGWLLQDGSVRFDLPQLAGSFNVELASTNHLPYRTVKAYTLAELQQLPQLFGDIIAFKGIFVADRVEYDEENPRAISPFQFLGGNVADLPGETPEVNAVDQFIVLFFSTTGLYNLRADANMDGVVDASDVQLVDFAVESWLPDYAKLSIVAPLTKR